MVTGLEVFTERPAAAAAAPSAAVEPAPGGGGVPEPSSLGPRQSGRALETRNSSHLKAQEHRETAKHEDWKS